VKSVKSVLSKLAAVAILTVLVWKLGTGAFVAGLQRIDAFSLASALAVGAFTTVLSAWRWKLVARGLGLWLPFGSAVADYYQALLLNAVLPMGVLGDVHRAVSHGRQAGDVGRSVRAVVLERGAGQVVTVGFGAAVLVTQPALVSRVAGAAAPGWTVGAVMFIVVVAGAVVFRRPLAVLVRGLPPREVWQAALLLSVAVLAGHVALFVVAARAAGSEASVVRLAPLLLISLLAMGLPLNVGGWGPREAVTAVAFGAAGLGAQQGLTCSVIYGVLATVACLPGAGVIAYRRCGPPVAGLVRRLSFGMKD
jgi:uncharacterized membrane protein YbhN (UPF0104 family)